MSCISLSYSLITEHRDRFGDIRLSDWFNRPIVIEQGNNFDDLTRGLTTQPEEKSNQFADIEVGVLGSFVLECFTHFYVLF